MTNNASQEIHRTPSCQAPPLAILQMVVTLQPALIPLKGQHRTGRGARVWKINHWLTTLKIDNMLLKKHFDKSIATQTELRLGENVMIGLTRCRLGSQACFISWTRVNLASEPYLLLSRGGLAISCRDNIATPETTPVFQTRDLCMWFAPLPVTKSSSWNPARFPYKLEGSKWTTAGLT